jgi:hypothetical protein
MQLSQSIATLFLAGFFVGLITMALMASVRAWVLKNIIYWVLLGVSSCVMAFAVLYSLYFLAHR